MKVEQIYTGCLAEAAYYIESAGEVAIIDPLRESKPYIERAEKDNAQIKYVFETHFHADFVSGHIDLSNKTGATIVFGPTAQPAYPAYIAEDGEEFKVGNIKIKVLHTPGHTMESSTFLLIDENGKENAIFSGDTLFIGDVGRPDLAVKSDLTQEDLAGLLYESLQNKILTLPDDVIVYPGHGAGSACGKNMSKETTDKLGNQKRFNYALQAKSKEQFVKEVLTGLVTPPQYFPKNAVMNKMGYANVDEVIAKGTQALSPAAFEAASNEENALVLDVRAAKDFAKGFIPNAINIGLEGQFASWVGTLITDLQQPILLITDQGKEEETITRLARVGYDNTIGYLKGGFEAWKKSGMEYDTVASVEAAVLEEKMEGNVPVFDVRKPGEYASEHIVDVPSTPLDFINEHLSEFPKEKDFYVHCAGGYRSMIAASILKARGINNFKDVIGGMTDILKTDTPRTADPCCAQEWACRRSGGP